MSEGINTEFTSEIKELGVIPIAEQVLARNQEVCGVISNIRDIIVPHTQRRDSSRFFTIVDPSTGTLGGRKIQSFHSQKECLPMGQVGDILICRGLTLSDFQGEVRGVLSARYFSASWTTLSIHDLKPIPEVVTDFIASPKNMAIAKVLQKWYKQTGCPLPPTPGDGSREKSVEKSKNELTYFRGKPFLTTAQIGEGLFAYCNFIGVYLGCRYANVSMTLSLTDFTVNPHTGGATKPSYGVSPDVILLCTLWDEHAENCPKLERGDYIMILNGRRKINSHGVLEISIHGDVLSPVYIQKVIKLSPDDERLDDIKARSNSANEHSKNVADPKNTGEKPSNLLYTESIELKEARSVITSPIILPLTTFLQMQTDGVAGKLYNIRGCVTDFRALDPAEWFLRWCLKCEKYSARFLKTCKSCKNPLSDLKYRFCLFLEDARGDQLYIFCIGSNIYNLFPGLPPSLALESVEMAEQLYARMLKLCPKKDDAKTYLDFRVKCIQGSGPRNLAKYALKDTKFYFE